MPCWVSVGDWVVVPIRVPVERLRVELLRNNAVGGYEPGELRIVVPSSHVAQASVFVGPVPPEPDIVRELLGAALAGLLTEGLIVVACVDPAVIARHQP